MKRFFTMIVAVCAFFAASAQRPLVTLSHEGNLSFFSTLSAFEDAMEAAVDGDIVYLSEGQFTTMADTVTINKRLSIQGCGYKSRVMCHLKMDMRNVTGDELELPLFDGVRLRTLEFEADSLSRNKTHNAEIRKCHIENIYSAGFAAKNFIIDRCLINYFSASGSEKSNVTILNSKIKWASCTSSDAYSSFSHVIIINCNIVNVGYLPKVTISSILGRASDPSTYYKIDESAAMYNTLYYGADCRIEEVMMDQCYNGAPEFDDYLNCISNLTPYKGQDGTVVGVYGGEFPFTENPSVPTVDSANSSVEYDAESNKLNVTITVLPN